MKRILVIDDDLHCRSSIIDFLEDSGFKVVGEGTNGKEAFEQYCSLNPDLVLMDLVMPNHSGLEGLQRIKEHDSLARVVIMSGDILARNRALEMGSYMFLAKPIDFDLLERLLNNL